MHCIHGCPPLHMWVLDIRIHVLVVSTSIPFTLSSSGRLAFVEWAAVVWLVGEMAPCRTVHSLLSLISGTEFRFHSVWRCAQLGSSISQLSMNHGEARRLTYSQRRWAGSVTGNFLESCVWELSQEGAAADSPAVCLEWELHVGPRQSFWVYDSFGGWKAFSEAEPSARQAVGFLEASVKPQLQPRCLFPISSIWEINSPDWIVVALCFRVVCAMDSWLSFSW